MLKGIISAFGVYSRIPVPKIEAENSDLRYMLCFFPWVGAVIGVCVFLWRMACEKLGIGEICFVLTGTAIPLIITGGFHADGFLDVSDSLCSYGSREKKLEILKDPHIGAFAVIRLAVYYLIYAAAFSEIEDKGLFGAACCGFFISRALAGISALCLPKAKTEGMLSFFSDSAEKKTVIVWLFVQGAACSALMAYMSLSGCIAALTAAVVSFLYYKAMCRRQFGGTTGDTAGYFVLICEGAVMVSLAAVNILM